MKLDMKAHHSMRVDSELCFNVLIYLLKSSYFLIDVTIIMSVINHVD